MNVLDGYTMFGRSWIFIGFQWTLISVQYAIAAMIPDESLDVTIQLRRTEFITSKLIDGVADEDYDIMPEGVPKIDPAKAAEMDIEGKLIKKMMKKGTGGGKSKDIPVGSYPKGNEPWPTVVSTNRRGKKDPSPTKNPMNIK